MIDRDEAYGAIADFVQALRDRDVAQLTGKFGLSTAVLDEIFETLEAFFPAGLASVGVAPRPLAFDQGTGRRNIELFQMNDPAQWGVECVLWENGRPAEPTLHLELGSDEQGMVLQYRYIGS